MGGRGGGSGGGGGGGGPDESELEALDEEDRIGEDEPVGSPTRDLFGGGDVQKDTSIPKSYTKEGLRSDEDEGARGELSDATTESPMRQQAMGAIALAAGLVLGGGLGAVRRWRRK